VGPLSGYDRSKSDITVDDNKRSGSNLDKGVASDFHDLSSFGYMPVGNTRGVTRRKGT